MKTISDWDIQAYLDNELTRAQQDLMARALQLDPSLRDRYNELRKQRDLLKQWWMDH